MGLGDLISTFGNSTTLLFDLDAQMSLTQAITLNEDGSQFRKFSDWSDRSIKRKKSIFNAIEAYTDGSGKFPFSIDYDFISVLSKTDVPKQPEGLILWA